MVADLDATDKAQGQRIADVSVVIPTFNRPDLLREAIEAELAQSVQPREIIVVDNGTNNDTRVLAEGFGDSIIYVSKPGVGRDSARNIGIRLATSTWVSLLDDDDYHNPAFLASVFDVIEDGRADVVMTDHRPFDAAGPRDKTIFQDMPTGYWNGIPQPVASEAWTFVDKFPVQRFLQRNAFEPGQMVVRRDLLLSVGAFDTRFSYPIGEIFDLNCRVLTAGHLAIVWKPLLMYRRHPGNSTVSLFLVNYYKLRTFEFIRDHTAMAPALADAFKIDLPKRRKHVISQAFEQGDFVRMREVALEAGADKPARIGWMQIVSRLPDPVGRQVSWFMSKAARRLFRRQF